MMSQHTIYKKIQRFKKSRVATVEGVNYAYVVAPFLYNDSFYSAMKKFVFSLFFKTRVSVLESQGRDLLLYYSARNKRREDYDYIPKRIREIVDCDYLETAESFSVLQPIRTVRHFFLAWRLSAGFDEQLLQRVACAALIAKYRSTAVQLFPHLITNRKRLITFCDAHAPENLLTQMARSVGVTTFTNQHGQYRLLDSSNLSVDAEAYANFVSNYMFCWGAATREEFVKFGFKPEQLIVTGWIKQWDESIAGSPVGVFGVMLNGENSRDSNAELLRAARSIAGSLNLKYRVRLHPWSKPSQYSHAVDDYCVGIGHFKLSEYLGGVDFSLAHMTGATIEVLHANAPIYLLDDGSLPCAFRVSGLSYVGVDQIIKAIAVDLQSPEEADGRFKKIHKWFNDDAAQVERLRVALGE